MARHKEFNYIITAGTVTIQKLAYPEGIDGDAVVAEEKVYAVADVPAELHVSGEGETATNASLAAYGLSQLLQDRVSSVDAEDKLDAMDAVFERLKAGQWKAVRASSGGGERKASIPAEFAEAVARFVQSQGHNMDAATATVWLQAKTAEERKALRAHESVKAFIQQVRDEAEAKANDLDLDALLG